MTSDHATIESTVSAPTVPESVDTHAMAMAREKALSKTTDRGIIIQAIAGEVERWCGRVFFRGPNGAARTAESVVSVMDPARPVSVCPSRPNVSGVVVSGVVVDVWDDAAADWTTPIAGTQDAPGGACNGSRGGLVPRPVLAPAGGAAGGPDWRSYRAVLRHARADAAGRQDTGRHGGQPVGVDHPQRRRRGAATVAVADDVVERSRNRGEPLNPAARPGARPWGAATP